MGIPLHAQPAATHFLRPKIAWQSTVGLEDGNKLGVRLGAKDLVGLKDGWDEGLQSFAQNGPKLSSFGSSGNVQAVAVPKVAVLP